MRRWLTHVTLLLLAALTFAGTAAAQEERLFTDYAVALRGGAVFPQTHRNRHPYASATLEVDVKLEGAHHSIDLGIGSLVQVEREHSERGVDAVYGIGGMSWYPVSGSTTPYVGALVMPQLADGYYEGFGLGAGGQVGVLAFRNGPTRAFMELRVTRSLFGLEEVRSVCTLTCTTDGTPVHPTEIGFALGIGF